MRPRHCLPFLAPLLFACRTPEPGAATRAADEAFTPVTRVEDLLIPAEQSLDEKFEEFEGGSAAHEQALNAEIVTYSVQMLTANRKLYPKIPRDAHAKSHGCLKAKFTVDNGALPPELRRGVFATNHAYDAFVRFSNNDHLPLRKDGLPDIRGMAIKVIGVDGEKILLGHEDDKTIDFLMYGSKTFFIPDIQGYIGFIKGLRDGNAAKPLLTEHALGTATLLKAQTKALTKINPLELSYFSATPVRLGALGEADRTAMKYGVFPCADNKIKNVSNILATNYMRDNLLSTLKESGDLCFEFRIQPRLFPETMPIEDATVAWPEARSLLAGANRDKFSPYLTVAKVSLSLADNRDVSPTYDMTEACEDMSFSPWRTLSAHKPLGRTMRMRRDVYNAIADFRRSENGVAKTEPAPQAP